MKIIQETRQMTTRDGVTLVSDVYRPSEGGKFPVLLMRQPYGRAIASTVVYAHPRWYAASGYVVIIQDVRGRGTSAGEFELFAREIEDGEDTVNWAASLPESNGKVGMYGFSYQGMTQLYAAVNKPVALKAIAPAMIAYDLYRDWAYENGAFCLQANLGWAVQLAAETARLKQDLKAYQLLYQASRNLPYSEQSALLVETLRKYAPSNFYYQWLNNCDPENEYWRKLSPCNLLSEVDLPMLHVGGWFDPYLRGSLNLYQEMVKRSQYQQRLIVGPWAHLPWGRKVGNVDYSKLANSPVDQIQKAWFDYFLKGIETPIINHPKVCLFSMGNNQWKYFQEFPSGQEQLYYLSSNGLAGIRDDGGVLVKDPKNLKASEDVLVHDPWRPVPANGGHCSMPGGSFERSGLECRSDILKYTTDPLTEDLNIVGHLSVKVFVDADSASFDLSVVLSCVHENGEVYNFTQGYKKIAQYDFGVEGIEIPLQATCINIKKGSCLRLSLAAACFPAYPVNVGKLNQQETSLMDAEIITLRVYGGGEYLSCLKFS